MLLIAKQCLVVIKNMNLIKYIQNKLSPKPFENKLSNTLNEIYAKKPSDLLVHNNGKIVRDGGKLFKIEHDFTDGIYLRRMLLNKGTAIISGIHKRDHVWFLLKGDITISSKDGVKNFLAPYIGFSKSGTQRAIYANEYSVFQNVFQNPLNITDIDEVENYNYTTTLEEYNNYIKNK